MLETICDIWTKPVIIITTNGVVKHNGHLVMGAGIALSAKNHYPDLPRLLGHHVKQNGNVPAVRKMSDGKIIISFPTKNDWKCDSSIDLIERSARFTVNIINTKFPEIKEIYMPRPGCSNGHLRWDDVKPILSSILDNRFIVCTPTIYDKFRK